ncbi:sugar nucleotide-binding protein [Halopseudomonas nanhaiensis]|uniref:sugar nucleotide-binding protein n=1 Tax=Halopseudomonas nanhaiensis TaxID=2830842 RepID=UPI001CBB7CD0|nr:sugar nucleotide-binding protein [Halopseudomonas nanhaiensis]UAW98114.1 sugar nucleotide-binding protein [Halopseudomonas nanhaiensis]
MRMRVLLLGKETRLGQALLAQATVESILLQTLDMPAAGWSEQALDSIVEQSPDLVVNLAFYHEQFQLGLLDDAALAVQQRFNTALIERCSRHDIGLFMLSSARVFDGLKAGAYTEKDQLAPSDPLGRLQAELEKQLRAATDRHLILRFSWLLDCSPEGLLGRLLEQMHSGEPVQLAEEWRGNPTPIDDAARVMLAILKQLDCDAPLFGTYHYGSNEISSWISFAKSLAQELLASQQLDADPVVQPVSFASQQMAGREPQNAALTSRRLLMAFGIKPRAWRAQLGTLIDPHNA